MTADHYTDTLEQVRRMVDALQAARESLLRDRDSLVESSSGPKGLEPDAAPFVAEYDQVLADIDAALAPVTGNPAPLCELIRWRLATDAERPDADVTVLLQLVDEPGGTVECGWWDGEQWMLCESGGAAVQADVRAWAEVWGPKL